MTQENTSPEPEEYNFAQALVKLEVSESTLRKMVRLKEIGFRRKRGKDLFFTPDDIRDWKKRGRVEPAITQALPAQA